MSQKTCECESPSFYTRFAYVYLRSPSSPVLSTLQTSAHAPVLTPIDAGTIVGNPMVKTAFEALDRALISGGKVTPTHPQAAAPLSLLSDVSSFSSALNCMSTVSGPKILGDRAFTIVEGAPETIKKLLTSIPDSYVKTCKWFTRRGSRVLAFGLKGMDAMSNDKIVHLSCELVESNLRFADFLAFNCPLKGDAVEMLKGPAGSSHRVRATIIK